MTALPPDVATDLSQENARLQAELRTARDRQSATAEILSAIASAPGDAERSLQQIAETSARLFGAPSATIHIAEGDGWARTIRFGASSKRVGAGVPDSQLKIGGRNMPGTIVAENRQVHVPDLDNVDPAIADWPGLPYVREAGTRSMSGSPLRREGNAIGALIVYRDRLAPFTAEELAVQQTFADQAAIAIENARLFNETREALERQTATAEILKVIASSPSDTTPVFEAIATSANRLLGGFSAAVFRFLDGSVHLAAFTPVSSAADAALKADFPRPVDEFEAFRLAQQGKPFPIPDTEEIPHPPIREIARLHGFRSMLFVPLMNGGVLIGIISVTRLKTGTFSPNHIQLLQTFADQAVIAIENTRLFNETQESLERQTATADILKVIASSPSDVQPVFDAIATSSKQLLGGFSATVFRFVDGVVNLAAYTSVSPAADKVLKASFPRPAANLPFFELAKRGEVVQEPDSETNPDAGMRELSRARGFRSSLFSPLMSKGTPIGLIVVTRKETGSFAEHHVQLLQTFADQAVIAIENVRLFDEVQAKTRDLTEALTYQTGSSNILKVIASSPTDVGPVLKAIVESACELCEADDAVVHLREGNKLRYAAHRGSIPVGLQNRAINRNFVTGRSVVDKVPIHLGDVLSAEGAEFPEAQEMSRRIGTRTLLSVPLLREDESIGAIVLRRIEVHPFSDKQIALLQTFADQAVIAIGNVRLFDEVQAKTRDLTEALQQQTATADVLKVISRSAFDLQTVFDTLLTSAIELSGASSGTICVRDGDIFPYRATVGATADFAQFLAEHPATPGRHSTAGRVILSGEVICIPDVLEDREFTMPVSLDDNKTRAHLGVPLLRNDMVEGALVLVRSKPGLFDERQIELVKTFADQAVIAIENVRLFDEVQARTKELSQSLDELRTAQDRLVQTEKLASLGQLTAGIAHEIKNPLNFVNNFAALSAELTDELNDALKSVTLTDKVRQEVDELTHTLKDNLERVVQHGKRADSIVKNMLLHSREGSGDHRPADINALLDESLNLAYHGARAEKREFNVTLQRDFDELAGTVEVFPQEITRVFLNLIANGFYAVTKRKTENGGSGFEPVLSATTKNLGDTVEIRIRDNGNGIPAEVREKMFNPFFTTKPAGEGTGLGLSMSHDIIVKQHGGRIDVETEPGQFTEFTIVLPRASSISNKIRGQT
jgi:two-component system NtrC family sensor kinase